MKLGLQIVLGVLSLIPLFFAVIGLGLGADRLDPGGAPAALDNQFRYLSGVYLLVTLLAWRIIPRVEREGVLLALVTAALFVGGLGRVVSHFEAGPGQPVQMAAMALELGAPLLILWQRAVAKRAL